MIARAGRPPPPSRLHPSRIRGSRPGEAAGRRARLCAQPRYRERAAHRVRLPSCKSQPCDVGALLRCSSTARRPGASLVWSFGRARPLHVRFARRRPRRRSRRGRRARLTSSTRVARERARPALAVPAAEAQRVALLPGRRLLRAARKHRRARCLDGREWLVDCAEDDGEDPDCSNSEVDRGAPSTSDSTAGSAEARPASARARREGKENGRDLTFELVGTLQTRRGTCGAD